MQLRDSPELGTAVFNTLRWILLLTGPLAFELVTRSVGKHLGGISFILHIALFLFVHSGILYLNDDFQGGGLFFTEMDTVTVTVSLGLAERGRKDGG